MHKSVLISIHPRFADLIISGVKAHRIPSHLGQGAGGPDCYLRYLAGDANRCIAAVEDVQEVSVESLWDTRQEIWRRAHTL